MTEGGAASDSGAAVDPARRRIRSSRRRRAGRSRRRRHDEARRRRPAGRQRAVAEGVEARRSTPEPEALGGEGDAVPEVGDHGCLVRGNRPGACRRAPNRAHRRPAPRAPHTLIGADFGTIAACSMHPSSGSTASSDSRYPRVFVTLELQAGFLVTAGTVALLGRLLRRLVHDFLVPARRRPGADRGRPRPGGCIRIFPRLRPISAWIGGARDEDATERAWAAAVGLPLVARPRRAVLADHRRRRAVLRRRGPDPRPLVARLLPARRRRDGRGRLRGDPPPPDDRGGDAPDPDRHQPRGLAAGRDRDRRRCRCAGGC